jgi:transglutaminase-like putative cysteine protease
MTEANRAPLRLAVAAALATAAAALGLERLVQTGPWVSICLALILVVGAAGHLARTARLPRPLVILAQLVAALLALTLLRASDHAIALFIPGPGALRELSDQVSAGRLNITQEAPPAAATQGITTILALVCAAFAILIDALAVTYRRAVLAGLPLLAVYLIPATRKPGGLSWLAFAVTAIGYLSLVSAEGHDRLSRWGRALGGPARMPGELSGPVNNPHSALSRRITSTAVVAALMLPWFIPTLPGVFKTGGGNGTGGDGTISINQSIDLRRSLTSSTALPLLRYTSTSSNVRSDYLQMSVLDKFDGNSWTTASVPESPLDASAHVTIPGLTSSGIKQTTVTTKISVIADLSFSAVPVPYAPSNVTGITQPLYDPSTLEIVPGDSTTRSRNGQQYTVTSSDIAPTTAQLEAATGPSEPSLSRYLALPRGFPADVTGMAKQVTAADVTPFEKAVALQDWFLASFSYSLSVPAGDGNSAIEAFLKDRKGFCQQFAGTMAAMARALGIPAVVSVGFTPGAAQVDGTYTVTTHDAHAWPMLYFNGLGWIRFEPTPSIQQSGRGNEPRYTLTPLTNVRSTGTAGNAVPSTGANPSASASACAAQIRRISGGCEGQNTGNGLAAARPFASWGPLGVVPRWFEHWFLTGSAAQIGGKLAALVLLLLAAVPALGRLARRRKRRVLVKQAERYLARAARGETEGTAPPAGRSWRQHDASGAQQDPMATIALAAWAELRECADDLGYDWVDSDTPRQAASRLTTAALLDEQASEAMGRVTTLTEQVRYAQTKTYDQPTLRGLPRDLRTLRAALAEHASRANRIKAAILPASSLSRLRDGRERVSASMYRGGRRRND